MRASGGSSSIKAADASETGAGRSMLKAPNPIVFKKLLRVSLIFSICLIVNVNWYSHERPIIQPTCFACFHIDTAVAHWIAKIVVPIGAVDTIAAVKIHHIRHIREIVARTSHVIIEELDPYIIGAGYGGCVP